MAKENHDDFDTEDDIIPKSVLKVMADSLEA